MMSGDIKQILEQAKLLISKDKERLGLIESENINTHVQLDKCLPLKLSSVNAEAALTNCKETAGERKSNDQEDDKENQFENGNKSTKRDILVEQKVPLIVEPLDWTRGYESPRDQEKRALIDSLSNSDDYFASKSDGAPGSVSDRVAGTPFGPPLLRRGEYAPPGNARLRAAPHAGLGEYELARALYRDRRKEDYLRHLAESKTGTKRRVGGADVRTCATKFVQTDIENINCQLVQYDPGSVSARRTVTDDLVDAALRKGPLHVDQRLTTEQNDILLRAMDKPKSILSNRRTGSPRDGYVPDLSHSSYMSTAFMDGFSYSDRSEELERERLKREAYQRELRIQIEEKRRLQVMREEQERRERELENRRLEQQLLRMQEEQAAEEQRRAHRSELLRRHSDDHLRRKTELHELQRPWRRHTESESGPMDGVSAAHYSPPVARRGLPHSSYTLSDPNRYSSPSYSNVLRKEPTSYDTVPLRSHRRFDRFDSLSRIDSLSHRLETMSVRDGAVGDLGDAQRRHSATQQDLSLLRKSPRLHRRNSASRFEESLPTPLLKARSPVAKELRNAVPFSSQRRGGGGGVLTQLGSIRAQLQREQMRMDETLRRRGLVRTRTTEDY